MVAVCPSSGLLRALCLFRHDNGDLTLLAKSLCGFRSGNGQGTERMRSKNKKVSSCQWRSVVGSVGEWIHTPQNEQV